MIRDTNERMKLGSRLLSSKTESVREKVQIAFASVERGKRRLTIETDIKIFFPWRFSSLSSPSLPPRLKPMKFPCLKNLTIGPSLKNLRRNCANSEWIPRLDGVSESKRRCLPSPFSRSFLLVTLLPSQQDLFHPVPPPSTWNALRFDK